MHRKNKRPTLHKMKSHIGKGRMVTVFFFTGIDVCNAFVFSEAQWVGCWTLQPQLQRIGLIFMSSCKQGQDEFLLFWYAF